MVGTLRDRLPVGRGGTILLVYLSFFVLVLGLVFIVVPAAIKQAEEIVASLPPFFDQARGWAGDLSPTALSRSVTALIDSVAGILRPPPPPDPDTVVEVGAVVAEVAVSLATLLTIVFFWLVEHARLQRYVLAFLPAERRAGARDAWNGIETRLGLWVRGQLILMGAMGAATALTYTILGLPAALLLGLIAAITEAIPIVGPLLGAIPAVLVAATVSPELAVVVAGVYIVLQFLEGSILVPLVMRNTIGISPYSSSSACSSVPPSGVSSGRSWPCRSRPRSRSSSRGCKRVRHPWPRTRPPSRRGTRTRSTTSNGRSRMRPTRRVPGPTERLGRPS